MVKGIYDCSAICNECDLPVNTIYLSSDGLLFYNINNHITGFQFDVYGLNISDISFFNEDLDFQIEYENGLSFSRVLIYSSAGDIIQSGVVRL